MAAELTWTREEMTGPVEYAAPSEPLRHAPWLGYNTRLHHYHAHTMLTRISTRMAH